MFILHQVHQQREKVGNSELLTERRGERADAAAQCRPNLLNRISANDWEERDNGSHNFIGCEKTCRLLQSADGRFTNVRLLVPHQSE